LFISEISFTVGRDNNGNWSGLVSRYSQQYIDRNRRGWEHILPSGKTLSVPISFEIVGKSTVPKPGSYEEVRRQIPLITNFNIKAKLKGKYNVLLILSSSAHFVYHAERIIMKTATIQYILSMAFEGFKIVVFCVITLCSTVGGHFGLKMDVTDSVETHVITYKIKRRHNTGDPKIFTSCCLKLKGVPLNTTATE
jgi:hypothetical protein